MKVLLVNGSPHKNGCTYTALTEVAETLKTHDIETEIFWIKTKPITGCIACMKCGEKGQCTFDNDVVNEFVKKAYDADAFVFGSPVYYASANGSMTSKYLGISQMPIISSFYWNMVHGNTPEEVMQDEEGLGTMRQLAHNMAFFLECMKAGEEKGLTITEEEKPRTNFIR